MNKIEAGKLGGEKTKIFYKKLKDLLITEYEKNPKYCKFCHSKLEYYKRVNIFCSKKCYGKYLSFSSKTIINKCLFCGKNTNFNKSKFCSISCSHKYKRKINVESGNAKAKTVKIYLIELYGNKCSVCGIEEWNNKPIIMDIEHIDGNSENNNLKNLCLICPNCHSQTSTYKGKNKGKGRFKRRERYKEGKSY